MKKHLLVLSILFSLIISLCTVIHFHDHIHAAGPKCNNCGSTNTSYQSTVNLATCTGPGQDMYICNDCGYRIAVEVPATGHNYGGDDNIVVISPATCTTSGRGTKTCINSVTCGSTIDVTIPALGHDWGAATVLSAPTCTSEGENQKVCSRCSEKKTYSVSALGHDYKTTSTVKATCTKNGSTTDTCSRCGDTKTTTIAKLGHNYKKKIVKEATCEEDGEEKYTCSRCNDTYSKDIPALGHDFTYEETEPTCLEEGHKKGTCSRCDKVEDEATPALGHDITEYTTTKEATCLEDGTKEGICNRCGDTVNETIAALGHDYPSDWTIEKEATYFGDGLKSKTCKRCDDKISETIPKLIEENPTPAIVVGAVTVTAVAGAVYVALTKSGIFGKKILKDIAKASTGKLIPKFETKTIVTTLEESVFTDLFKKQRYLQVKTCDTSDLDACIEENEPHIVIIDVISEERLLEIINILNDEENKQKYDLIIDSEIIKDNKEKLDQLKKDKKLVNYISFKDDPYLGLVKLILPILKPEIKSDETLENIGSVADALGIPGISTVINVYTMVEI